MSLNCSTLIVDQHFKNYFMYSFKLLTYISSAYKFINDDRNRPVVD